MSIYVKMIEPMITRVAAIGGGYLIGLGVPNNIVEQAVGTTIVITMVVLDTFLTKWRRK